MTEVAGSVSDGGARAADAGRRRFLAGLRFPPDAFQLEAFDILDAGSSVLVSAPTGSGKTLVAEYAIAATIARGTKVFYTTPLKALSNQKYRDLCAAHGEERVGLLTGDTAIRAHAQIVVMTTEVLRNMLLAASDLLARLETVILDEVHYLQDPYRGGVWEEVLVLSAPAVRFVCLSATVANASELGAWLRSVRGPVEVVVEQRRPITLRHHFAVHRRSDETSVLSPLLGRGAASDEALRIDQTVRRAGRVPMPRSMASGGRRPQMRLPVRSPRRLEVVELLEEEELLPAIVFIFSRAACDDAVRQCLRDGVRLTTRVERDTIREVAERHVSTLSDDDLGVLGYPEWMEGLEAGLGAHHAGLVPAYRETVEECFSGGLLKVVFATETLSLGINMPARTVVIERFTKFGGAGRATLTSGEYAQLTGRAGRRGHDAEGHAVVLFSPETPLADAARVALAPPPDLRSTFRPTYNLAVNLVRRFDRETAHGVLRSSFAQWQAHRIPSRSPELLTEALGRRLAVLEELGYVSGWSLTDPGRRLSTVYHESDLLVAESLSGDVLEGAEPEIVAGVLSAVVFEKRRARKVFGHARGRRSDQRRKGAGDRLGERRRMDLAERLGRLQAHFERIRALEEIHTVPRTAQPEPGLATAVAAWARGASFGATLDVAARDVGEMAPGDFVRTIRQLADLVHQVGIVAPDPDVARAATAAQELLLRDVVAAGTVPSSALNEGVSP
ncbi:MAG: DEAD/DEAH box helicase [Acidimicrobiales bacterium]